jgi:hypothetical protein
MAVLTLSFGKAEAKAVSVMMVEASFDVVKAENKLAEDPAGARLDILALYRANRLATGPDYTAAARIVSRSSKKEDLLMAHDFAIAGLALGDSTAKRIVAETQDRLFSSAGLGDRYGTLGAKTLPLTQRHRNLMDVTPPNAKIAALQARPVPVAG